MKFSVIHKKESFMIDMEPLEILQITILIRIITQIFLD